MFNTLTITNKPRWRKITGHAIYHIATSRVRYSHFDRIDKQQQKFTPTEVDIGATIEM